MCGLAGIFTPENTAVTSVAMDAMLKVMRHRGPDGTGQWQSEDHRYHCGFSRLAIIDISTSDQPIVEKDGRRVLMGNGEIYNYLELRQGAHCRDHDWQTQGDMEPVLPLQDALGDDFVQHLNGMYALALYDRASHHLTLVRDRLGIKPLYWCRLSSGAVIFASEIKALFASGLVVPQVDETAVASYLAHGWVPAPDTLWKNVRKLPPGHMLKIGADGTIREQMYWQVQKAFVPTDFNAAADHMLALLDNAVKLQLRADVPLGALLSGGLDSGLLVALAARRLDRPLNTYTVRFEGARTDETPLAALVSERYGTRHHVFTLEMADVSRHLPALAWHCDEPLADASLLPNHLISQILGHELRVVLNGTGGDELFAGYGRYFLLPVERRYRHLPKALRSGIIEPLLRRLAPMTAWRLARAEKFGNERGAYLHDHCTLFPPPILDLIDCPLTPLSSSAQATAFMDFDGPADSAALYADLCTYLPEDLLLLLDRTTMAASVEGRVPFLDHDVVEAALSLDPAVRTHGGRQKALERAMAAKLLPPELLDAPKQGFASPAAAWMSGALGQKARRILTTPAALGRGWWSRAGIDRLLANPMRHGHRLYALLMLELTIRIHMDLRLDHAPMQDLEDFIP